MGNLDAGCVCYVRENRMAPSHPSGTVRTGAGAQEENLHRRSDLCRFLERQRTAFYPMAAESGLLSRRVTVFRGTEADGYPLIDPFHVEVISVSAQARPPLGRWGQNANPSHYAGHRRVGLHRCPLVRFWVWCLRTPSGARCPYVPGCTPTAMDHSSASLSLYS